MSFWHRILEQLRKSPEQKKYEKQREQEMTWRARAAARKAAERRAKGKE